MNQFPLKTTFTGLAGGLFGQQHHPDDNLGALDKNAANTPSKDTQLEHPANQFHPLPLYRFLPSQSPFVGAPQFYHQAALNMTRSSQPPSGATHEYLSYGY
jgi:hypothetical protein